jgi:hypothetical protein
MNIDTLLKAASEGKVNIVKSNWAHFRGYPNVQEVTLRRACEDGQVAVVEWLAEATELRGNVVLLSEAVKLAFSFRQLPLVKWMIHTLGADVINFPHLVRGDTVLHYVIWRYHDDLTPLHKACSRGDKMTTFCDLIHDYGDNVNLLDNHGQTPLHMACLSSASIETVEMLMMYGADITAKNDDGETPAELAERKRRLALTKLLTTGTILEPFNRNRAIKKWRACIMTTYITRVLIKQRNHLPLSHYDDCCDLNMYELYLMWQL